MGKRKSGSLARPMLVRRDPMPAGSAAHNRHRWHDLYHLLLTVSWPRLLLVGAVIYLGANAMFAFAYLQCRNCIAHMRPGSFADAFYFSVQTLSTIGYGDLYPQTSYANAMVTVEAFAGMLWFAIAAGLVFARFSRPTARVLFSRKAVVAPFHDVPTLMFRAANQRQNQILTAQIEVTLVRNEVSPEGHVMRRMHDLPLIRARTPIFGLTWTALHAIDASSLLHGATAETLASEQAEIVVMFTGIDETFSQRIHARHSYLPEEIMWNHRLVDILSRAENGETVIDYSRFHDVVPL